MKRLAIAISLALPVASACLALDTRCFEINSTNDIAALVSIPEWRRGVDTNGITISVCIGGAVMKPSQIGRRASYPLSRELEFDKEGRLVRVSSIYLPSGQFDQKRDQFKKKFERTKAMEEELKRVALEEEERSRRSH